VSAAEGEVPLIARSYTRARRHPWVLGNIGGWTLPLGPYTPAQLVVAGVGILTLIQTYGVWAPVFGPLPVFAWGAAVWAVRSARIGGRVPAAALLGLLTAALEPGAGRIGGRTARDHGTAELLGGFHLTDTSESPRAAVALPVDRAAQPDPLRMRSSAQSAHAPAQPVPVTGVQRLLAAVSDRS
jgi:hypothetical protein